MGNGPSSDKEGEILKKDEANHKVNVQLLLDHDIVPIPTVGTTSEPTFVVSLKEALPERIDRVSGGTDTYASIGTTNESTLPTTDNVTKSFGVFMLWLGC